MRRLILALTAPLLLAQAHYEGGTLIAPVQIQGTLRLRNIPEAVESLAFIREGRTRLLSLPPELDGTAGRCRQVSHLLGTTYAVGLLHPPLPPGAAVRSAMSNAYFQSARRLYVCGPDGRWTLLAHLPRDTSYQRWTLVPLGAGRFLYGHGGMSWQDGAVSPFGIYRAQDGQLVLERLLDLGLGGPWFRAQPNGPELTPSYQGLEGRADAWEVRRVPSGLCLFHTRSRRWFLMDEALRRCRAQGRLEADRPVADIAAVAVRPDGRLLVALREGHAETHRQSIEQGPSLFQCRQGRNLKPSEQLALGRAEALEVPWFAGHDNTFLWQVLDPLSGQAHPVPPPHDFTLQAPFLGYPGPPLTVLPDGRLQQVEDVLMAWRRPKAIRFDWRDRLLKPFTHHWRKLMP